MESVTRRQQRLEAHRTEGEPPTMAAHHGVRSNGSRAQESALLSRSAVIVLRVPREHGSEL